MTVLVGDNAQGKSNFLEAIYFLATAKSFKADREEELIKSGETTLYIEGTIEQTAPAKSDSPTSDSSDSLTLQIAMQFIEPVLAKKIKVNGVPRRLMDYSGNLVVVQFLPEDINLVSGAPSLRRNYLDSMLGQIDRHYKKTLASYERVLVSKNKLLKRIREGFAKKDELIFWSDQQIMLGALISTKREEFFSFINQSVEKKLGNFKYQYMQSPVTAERLQDYQLREIDSATSLVGPHRDDFIFKLNDRELSKFGSRGEQRTAVLDLKLSEVEYIEQIFKERPILLLDDIFSELDVEHRQHVIEVSKLQQTIIVTVDWDDYLKNELQGAKIVYVKNGQLKSSI